MASSDRNVYGDDLANVSRQEEVAHNPGQNRLASRTKVAGVSRIALQVRGKLTAGLEVDVLKTLVGISLQLFAKLVLEAPSVLEPLSDTEHR